MKIRFSTAVLLAIWSLVSGLWAQPLQSRSGLAAAASPALRGFPCAGTTLFDETFATAQAGAAPAGWQIFNLSLPQAATDMVNAGYPNGWHSRPSFKDSTNIAMASLSYFQDTTARANNWLISPAITVGANTCLSWYAYSQDVYYPERYLVRYSKTPPTDTAAFNTQFAVLDTIWGETYPLNYRSVNLSAFAQSGETIYLAFQHISKNKFMLVLDDIRVADVPQQDAGIMTPDPIYLAEAGDPAYFYYRLRNYGSDTLKLDSIRLNYRINGGRVVSQWVKDTIALAANDTMQIRCDSTWSAADTAAYRVEMWASGFIDGNAANDTAWGWVYIGFATAASPSQTASLGLWPNPADEWLHLSLKGAAVTPVSIQICDLTGKPILSATRTPESLDDDPLSISHLAAGVYILSLTQEGMPAIKQRLVIQ